MSIVERAGVHKNDFAITKHHFLLKKTMEMLRQRLLDCAIKQSDLMEIFSAINRDCSGRITFQEFSAAIKSLDIGIDDNEEIKDLFQQFDTTKNGQIDLYEFLQQLRPPMNERRRKAALDIFNSMDVDKDGKLTIADLKTKYATQLLPARRRSSENIDLALRKFLDQFDTPGQEDGVIEQDEFFNFCSMLSATVKEDVYFEHALRTIFDFNV